MSRAKGDAPHDGGVKGEETCSVEERVEPITGEDERQAVTVCPDLTPEQRERLMRALLVLGGWRRLNP